MKSAFKDFAILFLLIVAAGLLLRQHRPAEIAVSPVTPASVRHGFVCTTPLVPTARIRRPMEIRA